MSLYKRRLTQLDGIMGPALRVACMDAGKGREQGCGSFAYMDVGKEREKGYGSFTPEKAPPCVACRDGRDCSRQSHCISTIHGGHSQGREQDAVSFARCSFGTTTKSPGAILRISPAGVRHRDVSNKLRASRLAYRDGKGCSGQPLCIPTIPGGHGKEREHGCGSFDWHFFRGNSNNLSSVNRP